MAEFRQMPPEELFTRTLQLFKMRNEDFMYRGDNTSSHETDFKYYMNELFRNLEHEKDHVKRNKLVQLVKLRDQYGLSILGYILLIEKRGGLRNLYSFVKHDDEIKNIISSMLNSELSFILTHYFPDSNINNLIGYIIEIKQYVPSFALSVENAKLIGYMMARDKFKSVFDLPNMSRSFVIPDHFVPYVEPQPLPPPGPPPYTQQYPGPPSHPPPPGPPPGPYPPPPLPYPHLPSYPQQYPPPFSRNGGTRKNHKRHKKQMRKHASKKSKHA